MGIEDLRLESVAVTIVGGADSGGRHLLNAPRHGNELLHDIYIYMNTVDPTVEEIEMDQRQAMPQCDKPQWNSTYSYATGVLLRPYGSLGSLVERRPSPPGVEVAVEVAE